LKLESTRNLNQNGYLILSDEKDPEVQNLKTKIDNIKKDNLELENNINNKKNQINLLNSEGYESLESKLNQN